MTEGHSKVFGGGQARSMVLLPRLLRYGVALLLVALALGTNLLFHAYLKPTPTPLFFAAVMVSAWYGGLGPGLLATALSTLAINYFYIEPLYSFNINNLEYLARLSVFVMAALLINSLNQAQRSAQRKAEANLQALRDSEAKFQVLVRNMPGMVYRYAPCADGLAAFTYVSSGSRELTELEPESILQDAGSFLTLIHPDDLPSFHNSVAIAVENSAIWQWEGRIITPSGQLKWVQGRSRPQPTDYGEVWDGLLFDITEAKRSETERKQAEEAFRQSEERLRVALKNSPITVFNQDQELRYTWIYNPTFEYHVTEVIGKQDRDLLPEEDAANLTRIKRHVLETGNGVREEVKLTMQGQDFYYDLTVEPLQNEDGETVGVTCASVDITQRKQLELALRQSKITLNALIASSPIGIALFDRELRYVHVNEALAATNGIPLSEHLGRTVWEVLPEWAPIVVPVLQRVMDTKEPLLNQEVSGVTHPADFVRHGLVNYFPVCLTDGQVLGVGVTSMDVTDRKRVQQELQQTLQTLQTIVAASPLPIIVIESDMTVQLWNAAAEKMFGWSEAEVLGQLLPLVPAEKQEECRQLREAVTGGEIFFGVETYRCKRDGSKVILNISAAPLYGDQGSVNGILLILQDITEQQQAEANLRDSEERLRLALIAANQGLYDLNVQTGEAIVSPAYAQMLGYDPDEFQETNAQWRDRLHPDDDVVVYQAYQDYIAGKLDTYRVEFRQRTQSGDWKWILSIGKVVSWDSEGQPLRMLGTHTDITDRKQAETEREQLLAREQAAREEAETANRIKDEFLAVLSHELRSPLNPILGWAKLLQTQKLDEQKTRLALATIERNTKLQSQLIEDLLDVSRILRGKLVLNIAPVSLSSTIEAALETVRLAVEAKAIDLRFEVCGGVDEHESGRVDGHSPSIQVMGDAARLQQVIWNLLTNAVKFTPEGGRVEVRLEKVATDEKTDVTDKISYSSVLSATKSVAQIQVKDTGKGINPEFLPYVFDYFRQEDGTTTRKFGGLGLGLAIVRHITELHGGTVWAESLGEGRGATFTVQLPLLKDEGRSMRDEINSPPSALCPLPLQDVQILAVDDDEDICELLEFMLQQAGAEVRVVKSATEALQQVEAFPPDVLISDVGMPDMDGYMLMRQISTLVPEEGMIPAIALTAYAGEIDQQQAIAAGFQMHLAKPVEPENLIGAIVNLLKKNQANTCEQS